MAEFLPSSVGEIQDPEAIFLLQQLQRRMLRVDFEPSITERSQSTKIATAYVHTTPAPSIAAPILLLPGFDSSLLEFRRLFPLLAERHDIWAIDPWGFGFTEYIPTLPVNPQTIQQHLLSVIVTWIQQPVILVGASLGGAVAINVALHHPNWVRALVLIDSVGFSGSFPIGQFLPRPVIEFGADWLYSRKRFGLTVASILPNINPILVDAIRCSLLHQEMPGWKATIAAFTESGGYANLSDRIAQINHPTLILWGAADDVLGTEDATRFEKAIPGSQLVWIEKAHHVPHLDNPQSAANHLLAFAQRIGP